MSNNLHRYSFTVEMLDDRAVPKVMRGTVTCDSCGWEYLVNSPDAAKSIPSIVTYHPSVCPKPPR